MGLWIHLYYTIHARRPDALMLLYYNMLVWNWTQDIINHKLEHAPIIFENQSSRPPRDRNRNPLSKLLKDLKSSNRMISPLRPFVVHDAENSAMPLDFISTLLGSRIYLCWTCVRGLRMYFQVFYNKLKICLAPDGTDSASSGITAFVRWSRASRQWIFDSIR